jgi:hypothetical protein
MKTGHLLLALAVLALGHTAYPKGVSFPGRDSCLSPGKSWKVICQVDKLHEGAFKLILRNLKKGSAKELFDGGRWCEVLWQKDESHLAITDWGGSNFSEILVQDPSQLGPARSLQDVINMATIRASVGREEFEGHCYWEALSWQADGRLRFRIFGHTDNIAHGREFSHLFLVKLPEGSVSVLKSKGQNPQGGANGRQPIRSQTSQAPATAAPRRSP